MQDLGWASWVMGDPPPGGYRGGPEAAWPANRGRLRWRGSALAALLAAALGASVRLTAAVAVVAVALSAAARLWNDYEAISEWWIRLVLCTVLAVLAVEHRVT